MDYESDMYIDHDALDIECLDQSQMMMKYTKKLATLKLERDQLKEEVDLVRAEQDKAIRENPESFGLVKITETAINNTILTTKEYKSVMKEYLQAKFEVDTCQGAVSAVEQRKSMIEALIKLHGQQYFAGPSIPRQLNEEREKRSENVQKKIASKMTRRTK
jgi:hypothetical protein